MPFSPTSTPYLVGTPNGVLDGFVRRRVRVANLAFEQTNSFYSFVCLLLVCSFSPKVQKYLLGSPSPIKRREFDGFLGFFAGSENPSVLSVHEFSGSVKTPKRRELSPFCLIVLVLKQIEHLPAPADKQRIAVKQRLVRGEVDNDIVVALDRKNVDVVFFADIQRHKGASRPT